eukprot:4007327-Amphidinium_carterae.2
MLSLPVDTGDDMDCIVAGERRNRGAATEVLQSVCTRLSSELHAILCNVLSEEAAPSVGEVCPPTALHLRTAMLPVLPCNITRKASTTRNTTKGCHYHIAYASTNPLMPRKKQGPQPARPIFTILANLTTT